MGAPKNRQTTLIVMGVTGCGKTSLGRELAACLDATFTEGDDLHPPANRSKMTEGHALNDADRAPWLAAIAQAANENEADACIVSCSALKRQYREQLREDIGGILRFVWLDVSRDELVRRLQQRRHHFMPSSLLDSQLEILEPPTTECDTLRLTPSHLSDLVEQVTAWLSMGTQTADHIRP